MTMSLRKLSCFIKPQQYLKLCKLSIETICINLNINENNLFVLKDLFSHVNKKEYRT